MIRLIENGVLSNDFDCAGHNLLNLGQLLPPPSNVVAGTDPRLSDQRIPLDGSVTNAKVGPAAAIAQSKLNLNGAIPGAWLGTTLGQAAPGDKAEYIANRGVANGYASLDSTGKVPNSQMATGAGLGTVTSVALTVPPQFGLSGSPITGSGTFALSWASVADGSWFGNVSGGIAPPTFQTSAFPVALIPNLDAAKITTGFFALGRLPVAVGVGGSHAAGIVPDPGASGTATDYLARDMTYKAIPSMPTSYRPQLSNVVLSPSSNITGARNVTSGLGDPYIIATRFYSLISATGPFTQFGLTGDPTTIGYVVVPPLATVWFYSAAPGYLDSTIVSYTNPNTV